MTKLKPVDGKIKTFKPVRPNLGIEASYRTSLLKLIDEMHASITYWIRASYKKADPPTTASIAQDAAPVKVLERTVRELSRQWERNFDEAAAALGDYYARKIAQRSETALRKALKDGGFSVRFKMTKAAKATIDASIQQQVGLIKSIPQKYLLDVQGAVMRSVQTGRDLASLSKELQDSYGVTKRRAATIARDQNNKATASITKVRQNELGLTTAIWRHSHAGEKPRPTHLQMDGKKYDVREGMYDPAVGRKIWPGEEINCRCYSRTVVPGF